MSLVFPESYDELAVLAHHGATAAELARRLTERELMTGAERFRADVNARAHVGPTIDDHRTRWARRDGTGQPENGAPDIPADIPPDGGAGDIETGDVPTGPMADILAWVGHDPTRALAATHAENARTDPRTSLLTKLAKITNG